MLREHTNTITTDESGDATVYLGSNIRGRVESIKYAPGTIETGATLTVTGETSKVAILTKADAGTDTVWFYPVAPCNKAADGSASTVTEEPVTLYDDRVKVMIATGGDTLTGSITVRVDEEP